MERIERVDRWITLINSSAEASGLQNIQLISDTVFAATQSSTDGLGRLIHFAQLLLNNGVPKSLSIRGAICHGEYAWGKLTHGKAVVQAHELEQSQNWIGVICDSGLPHLEAFWGHGSLILYPTPMKGGPIMLRPTVDWNIPAPSDLHSYMGREGLAKNGEVLTWAFGEKFNNTIQYAIYKQILTNGKLDPKTFHGSSVIEVIHREMFGH